MDIPLPRDDIVRLTDIDNKGRMAGNDVAGDGFFVGVKHKAHEIRCPSDQTDNDSTGGSSSTRIALTTVSASELQRHIINAELIDRA